MHFDNIQRILMEIGDRMGINNRTLKDSGNTLKLLNSGGAPCIMNLRQLLKKTGNGLLRIALKCQEQMAKAKP